MCNIKDNIPTSKPNKITGSYGSEIVFNNLGSDNIFCLPSIFCENDLEKQYIDEKKNMEKYLNDIQLVNIDLLQNIYFFDKKCRFVNITHSNTNNFIMRNYIQLKQLINNYAFNYNKNINKIILTKEKINNINSDILYLNYHNANII